MSNVIKLTTGPSVVVNSPEDLKLALEEIIFPWIPQELEAIEEDTDIAYYKPEDWARWNRYFKVFGLEVSPTLPFDTLVKLWRFTWDEAGRYVGTLERVSTLDELRRLLQADKVKFIEAMLAGDAQALQLYGRLSGFYAGAQKILKAI